MLSGKGKLLATGMVLAMVTALAFGCAPADDGTPQAHLGYVEWASETASTYVVATVLEQELGYEVEVSSAEVAPMFTGVAQGSYDGIVAAWLPHTHADYMDEFGDQFEFLGKNLEGAKIGWVVPQYVDVDSIEDINEVADEFDGQVIGIDPGAGLMRSSEAALEEYQLDNFELVDGSDAAMTAALSRAIDNEEWIIVTGWTPHWKFVRWDLKYLEDPKGVFGDEEYIGTIVREGLAEDDPVLYEFLGNFYWTPDDMGEVMILIEEGMSPEDAAAQWVSENMDKVEAWLPAQ